MSERWIAHHADVLDVLAGFESNSVDAVLTDPPYGLGGHQPTVDELIAYLGGAALDTGGDFMGRDWSVPSVRVWRELLRVLRPGGHVLAFGGSRTGDLISLGMRAGGLEIRDCFQWIYASGYPKSLAADKAIDAANGDDRPVYGTETRLNEPSGIVSLGRERTIVERKLSSAASAAFEGYGTAVKPAYEPIFLGRKPLDGTVADNLLRWGVGALAIDACRIEYADSADQAAAAAAAAAAAQRSCRDQNENRTTYGRFDNGEASLGPYLEKQGLGRWPANVLLDEGAAADLDIQSGDRPGMSGGGRHRADYGGGMFGSIDSTATARGDSGGASRFFFVAKPSREERERGCSELPHRSGVRNFHPTLKPVALCRYLAALLLPPPRDGVPRRIAVPFAGSGSEMCGALLAGWDVVEGIERDAEFLPILRARVHLAATNPRAFEPFANRKADKSSERQGSLFAKAVP